MSFSLLSFSFYIFWLLFNIISHIYYCYSIILFLLLLQINFHYFFIYFDVIVWKDSINFPAPFCFFGFHNSQCIDPFLMEDFSFPQVFFHHIIIFNQHAKNIFIDIFEFSRPNSYSETLITNLWHIFICLFENEFIFISDCSFHSHWDKRNCFKVFLAISAARFLVLSTRPLSCDFELRGDNFNLFPIFLLFYFLSFASLCLLLSFCLLFSYSLILFTFCGSTHIFFLFFLGGCVFPILRIKYNQFLNIILPEYFTKRHFFTCH